MVSSIVGKDVRRLGVDLGVNFAIASISAYQKYLSPYKGFACAHRVLYGGESCSQYVKRMLGEVGFSEAIKASRQRLADCREANQILKASRDDRNSKHRRKPCQNYLGCDGCDVVGCGCDGIDCLPDLDCDLGECGSCPLELECGSCDCSF
ncbi:MAG: membrane protein insertion efficiency factor YidD [Lyngbya sp.]|nr:membrane protein insertion efficiency factor YidD [Lyngbya sp.]